MQHISINPWPYGHSIALVIRDDDISYFTPPHKIDRIYERAWKQGFKVSLAVIPRLKATGDPCVPPRYRGEMSEHIVCNNRELINYLKERVAERKVDIVQHGYNHDRPYGVPEFCTKDPSEIRTRLRLGRKTLEECLPTKIIVFVPPWNRVSKQAWNALKLDGLALCRREKGVFGLIQNTPWSFGNLVPFTRILWSKIFSRGTHPFTEGIIKFPGMIELYPSLDWWKIKNFSKYIKNAKQEFTDTTMVFGLFCIVNHHWFYYEDWQDNITNEETLRHFYVLLDFLDAQDVWKATLTDVVNWIKEMDKIEIKVKRGMVILKSPTTLRGVTIRGENCTLTPADEADVEVRKQEDTALLIYKKLEASERKIAFIDS